MVAAWGDYVDAFCTKDVNTGNESITYAINHLMKDNLESLQISQKIKISESFLDS